MHVPRLATFWFAIASSCLSAQLASAQKNPLGLYVGAGLGTATIRQASELDTGYYGLSREQYGWDAFIGVRPPPYLGAEIGYLDVGSADRYQYTPGGMLLEPRNAAS